MCRSLVTLEVDSSSLSTGLQWVLKATRWGQDQESFSALELPFTHPFLLPPPALSHLTSRILFHTFTLWWEKLTSYSTSSWKPIHPEHVSPTAVCPNTESTRICPLISWLMLGSVTAVGESQELLDQLPQTRWGYFETSMPHFLMHNYLWKCVDANKFTLLLRLINHNEFSNWSSRSWSPVRIIALVQSQNKLHTHTKQSCKH